ncbi:MAG: hypothetical protein IJP92_00260 [Lachnospiraceae bacterium]|nr:hypothetical protein [Lachnospiraceae bacterium]
MTATAETIEKLNSLKEDQFIIVTNLIDHFYLNTPSTDDVSIFQKMRESLKDHWKTDEELDAILEEIRAERRANRS